MLKNDMHLISIALQLLQKMMFLHPMLMQVLIAFPNIEQILQLVFLKIQTERIQSKFSQTLFDICKKLDQDLPKANLQVQEGAQQLP